MKITTTQIWSYFHSLKPNITVYSGDYEYWKPTEKELREILAAGLINLKQYVAAIGDCDKYALVLHSQIVLMRWGLVLAGVAQEGDEGHLPWAFGQIEGHFDKYKEFKGNHRINFCMLQDRTVLIEPQSDEIWDLTDKDDFTMVFY